MNGRSAADPGARLLPAPRAAPSTSTAFPGTAYAAMDAAGSSPGEPRWILPCRMEHSAAGRRQAGVAGWDGVLSGCPWGSGRGERDAPRLWNSARIFAAAVTVSRSHSARTRIGSGLPSGHGRRLRIAIRWICASAGSGTVWPVCVPRRSRCCPFAGSADPPGNACLVGAGRSAIRRRISSLPNLRHSWKAASPDDCQRDGRIADRRRSAGCIRPLVDRPLPARGRDPRFFEGAPSRGNSVGKGRTGTIAASEADAWPGTHPPDRDQLRACLRRNPMTLRNGVRGW
jgi:hypothetical protein